MEPTYSILNTIQAAAADLSIAARVLGITGAPRLNYPSIASMVQTNYNAETLQIATVAYTVANNTTYSFSLKQIVNGNILHDTVTYTSDSNATAAEIAAAISNIVTARGFKITPSGVASPVTLTAQAGYPVFTIVGILNTTVVVGTPGVEANGTAAKVTALVAGLNATSSVAISSTGTYRQYAFTFEDAMSASFGVVGREAARQHWLFVDESATNFAAFNIGLVTNVLNGYTINLGVANTTVEPEVFSVL